MRLACPQHVTYPDPVPVAVYLRMSAVSALMAVITPMETGERWLVAAPAPAPPTQPALDTGCRRNCSVAARQMLAQGLSTSYPLGLELKKGFWLGGFSLQVGFLL